MSAFRVADDWIVECIPHVQSIQAGRLGALAPGPAECEGLVQPVPARDLVGKRCADIIVIVASPGEDEIPIATKREGHFRERGPAPALARSRVAGGPKHVARVVGTVENVSIIINIPPVLVGDFGARHPPHVAAIERECRSVQGDAGRPGDP